MNQPYNKKTIVVSGINLFLGGTLTILHDCLTYLEQSSAICKEFTVVALVHNKKEFEKYKNIQIIEYHKSRQSWLYRLYYEYVHFQKLSRRMNVHLWFSLHDITPNVIAEKRAVYCHNPAPFYKVNSRERALDKRFVLFNWLYKYLYAVNIKKNDYVVVQQNWIREEFMRLFRLPLNHIIVAHPDILVKKFIPTNHQPTTIRFLYPALPRVFKNFEVIIKAVEILKNNTEKAFEVIFTIDGKENKYAEHIKVEAEKLSQIKLAGLQASDEMSEQYQQCTCVLFPSRLETWGLPLTEAKFYNKPILAAGLPYARETVGDYSKVSFFAPDDANKLAALMKEIIDNNIRFEGSKAVPVKMPFSCSWEETFQWLLS